MDFCWTLFWFHMTFRSPISSLGWFRGFLLRVISRLSARFKLHRNSLRISVAIRYNKISPAESFWSEKKNILPDGILWCRMTNGLCISICILFHLNGCIDLFFCITFLPHPCMLSWHGQLSAFIPLRSHWRSSTNLFVIWQVRFLARLFAVPGNHLGQQSHGYRWPYGPVRHLLSIYFVVNYNLL